MNRFFYVVLITAITIAGFTMYSHHDTGYISIGFANFSFKTNLLIFGAALLSALFLLTLLIKFFRAIKSAYQYIFTQRKNRLQLKAKSLFNQSIIEYTEGKFEQAEKTLLNQVVNSENILLTYLTAAKAAQHQGSLDRRDDYLRRAFDTSPEAAIAIGITQAQLQLEQFQNEQALATLQRLHQKKPEQPFILQLLVETYERLEDWDNLFLILPELKKQGQLSSDKILDCEISICHGRLNNLTKQADFPQLQDYWLQLENYLKKRADIIEHYARCLIQLNLIAKAEKELRLSLNKNWSESTIKLYSEIDVQVDNKVLDMVETWLNNHQQNTYLLLALGNICLNLSLWGKTKNYLEASIAIKALPETYLRLAQLLEEHMNDTDAADYYRQGLLLLVENYNEQHFQPSVLTSSTTPQLKIVKQ